MFVLVYLQIFFTLTIFTSAGPMSNACSEVNLIGRDQWGARPPKEVTSMKVPVSLVFIHHTAMGECFNLSKCISEVKKVQDLHMISNSWSDIGYNFLVGEDGRVYEARGWNRTGAHTKYYNHIAVAVSVMGNFEQRVPNRAALDAVQNIIDCGVDKGFITRNYALFGHRDVRETQCPGDAFYAHIRQWSHYSFEKPEIHLPPKDSSVSMCIPSLKLVVIGLLLEAITILVNF